MKTTQSTGAAKKHYSYVAKDFALKVRNELSRKGITVIGSCVIPGDGPMPYTNGSRGYQLDNNGQFQIRSYAEVIALGTK